MMHQHPFSLGARLRSLSVLVLVASLLVAPVAGANNNKGSGILGDSGKLADNPHLKKASEEFELNWNIFGQQEEIDTGKKAASIWDKYTKGRNEPPKPETQAALQAIMEEGQAEINRRASVTNEKLIKDQCTPAAESLQRSWSESTTESAQAINKKEEKGFKDLSCLDSIFNSRPVVSGKFGLDFSGMLQGLIDRACNAATNAWNENVADLGYRATLPYGLGKIDASPYGNAKDESSIKHGRDTIVGGDKTNSRSSGSSSGGGSGNRSSGSNSSGSKVDAQKRYEELRKQLSNVFK